MRQFDYATFPARFRFLVWPFDHLYVTPEFTVRMMEIMDLITYRFIPKLCIAAKDGRARNSTPDAAPEEHRDGAAEVMNEYREDQAEEARGEE